MPTTKSNSRERTTREKPQLESPREITTDVVEYLIDYAHKNPGYAALTCIGVGFVLGWKLKPW